MKRFTLISIALATVAGASAATFTNDVVAILKNGTIDGAASYNIVSVGDMHAMDINGLTLSGANFDMADVAWSFDFDATPAVYTGVTFTIEGDISSTNSFSASADIIGTEKVYNSSATLIGDGVINQTVSSSADGSLTHFVATVNIPFSQGAKSGKSLKDSLFLTDTNNANVTITSIKQSFTPVPEPASMAALGIGIAAMIRRRRKA